MAATPPRLEPNPLQRALDTYHELERQHRQSTEDLAQIRAENAQLLSEVGMLREHLQTVEAERTRWHVTATTLLGRLFSINDVIGGAVKAAIKDGLEAKPPVEREEDLEKAGAEVAEILQRAAENGGTQTAPAPEATPEPPQAQPATIPRVDFGTPEGPQPQGWKR